MYECVICRSKVKIPSLLYLAIPEVKTYELKNYNICKVCAKDLLDSMYIDDEATKEDEE